MISPLIELLYFRRSTVYAGNHGIVPQNVIFTLTGVPSEG